MKTPNANSDQITVALAQWVIGRNAQRNREITKRKIIDGITFELLAEEFDMSVRQTKNIVYKCNDIICLHLPV